MEALHFYMTKDWVGMYSARTSNDGKFPSETIRQLLRGEDKHQNERMSLSFCEREEEVCFVREPAQWATQRGVFVQIELQSTKSFQKRTFDSVVPYAVATLAHVAPGQLLIVFVHPLPPGGIQIGVNFQIELQLRKLLALKMSVAESPNLVATVMHVSLSPAAYLVTHVSVAVEVAELDVLVDVEVWTSVGVLVVAPAGTQMVSGVHSQISSQLSHEGFEDLIKATVVPNLAANLVQLSPLCALYELQTLFPLLDDVEVELEDVDVDPLAAQMVSGVFAQISSQLSHDGFEALIESTVVPNFVASLVQVSPDWAVYALQADPLEVDVLAEEVEVLVDPTQMVRGVFAQISSQLSHEGFEALIEATVVPNFVASFVQVSPACAVYALQPFVPVGPGVDDEVVAVACGMHSGVPVQISWQLTCRLAAETSSADVPNLVAILEHVFSPG